MAVDSSTWFKPAAGYDWHKDTTDFGTKPQTTPSSGSSYTTPTSDSYGSPSSSSYSGSPPTGGSLTLADDSSVSTSSYSTADNGAGPGFGARSDSNSVKDPSQPWLYKGNVGVPYGSNMQAISAADASKYKYTNTFTNNSSSPETINVWNKVGRDGQANSGQSEAPAMSFVLQPGQSQAVAFDENSQVAWSASQNGSNQGATWGEGNFGDASTGWNGYDISQIMGHAGNMSITNAATGDTVTQADSYQQQAGVGANPYDRSTQGALHLNTTVS